MSKLGIYIHIPFCKRRCNYCDFYSTLDYGLQDEYVDKVKKELEYYSKTIENKTVDTVYFGGGTPTSLNKNALSDIFDTINSCFYVENTAEITVEANPDTINDSKVEELKSFANRVSVGVQSLNDKVLSFAGRIHNSKTALLAIDKLVGKFSLNADIMLGLPYSTIENSAISVRTLIEKGVDHLSCYGLKVENGTPFSKQNKSLFPDDDRVADEYDEIKSICNSYGLDMYEVSNFAKAGKECKHNIRYWQREDYLGVGASAHSYMNNARYYNPSSIKDYIKKEPIDFRVLDSTLSVEDRIEECIMLSLRMKKGIDTIKFEREFGVNFFDRFSAVINKLKPYLNVDKNFISIKEQNFYAMNSIIVEFLS